MEADSKGNLDEYATQKADGVYVELLERQQDSVCARRDRLLDSRAAGRNAGICSPAARFPDSAAGKACLPRILATCSR